MSGEIFQRMEILYGHAAMEILKDSHVLVLGIGGVGGHCVDALARCGVGSFTLVDGDLVSVTNLNRQMVALHSTLGRLKVDVMRERIQDINPEAHVYAVPAFYSESDTLGLWEGQRRYTMVVDAIDSISAKVDIAWNAQRQNIPCISCMGAGNKRNPMGFMVADLYQTSVCPLARSMRKACKEKGVFSLPVVYSKELPQKQTAPVYAHREKPLPGSVCFATAAAGLLLAAEAVSMCLKSSPLNNGTEIFEN